MNLEKKMECGHPRAYYRAWHDVNPETGDDNGLIELCTACAEVESALRRAAEVIKKWKFMACSDADGLQAEVVALIPSGNHLAHHDKELVERMKDHLVSMEGWADPETLAHALREARREEAQWWAERVGKAKEVGADMLLSIIPMRLAALDPEQPGGVK